jgi:hypothetical protein
MTNVWLWSGTAASNATADGSLWAEGQLPSTVNDSARDNMASIAKFRDDISGKTATTGSANAYVLTPATNISAYADGMRFAFRANFSNTGAATLNVNALGAKSIKKWAGTALNSGELVSGAVYEVIYNLSSDEFRLIATVTPQGNISFPATQVASSDANTLDDYEEGTWTPAITFGGASTGVTYTSRSGSYVKIGKYVFLIGAMVLSSKGSSTGNAQITGTPFTTAASSGGGSVAFSSGFTGLTGALVLGMTVATADAISLGQMGATGVAFITDTSFTNTTRIDFSIAYIAAT